VGVTRPASLCDGYVMIEDIFPTFLEMSGIANYHQIGGCIDGVSFAPFLKGKKVRNQNRAIFWHFPHTYDQFPYSTVRLGDWKMIYHHLDGKLELYNIQTDVGETIDLAGAEPECLKRLATILTSHLKKTNALMPIDKRTGNPVAYPIDII